MAEQYPRDPEGHGVVRDDPGGPAARLVLLDYVMAHDGVWIAPRLAIARHGVATHPYPGKGLNE